MDFRKFIKEYNEWFLFPIALALFFLTPRIYRLVDPTAGQFDAGIFHSSIYAVAMLFLFSGIAWLILKIKFPDLKKYLDDAAEFEISKGVPHQQYRASIAFAIYFALIFIQVIILFSL